MPTESNDHTHYALALRPGTELDGCYRVSRVLGQTSAFAITYLARDERADGQVVIKEFLPRTLAGRASDELSVRAHSPDDAASLSRALRRFAREAELLADIAHPNVPRVRRHFEANGTAYMVLQHYDGKTLAEYAAAGGGRLPLDGAIGLVLQVLRGLEALHAEGIVHGYITPDSVLVDGNARALILGLGTTRHVVGSAKEPAAGFAPIEQYASKEVGPWTDVYACAAMLYRLATGSAPPSAVERSAGQSIPLSWAASANVPSALARTIIAALAQLPDTRPHSAEEFRRRLDASLALAAQTTPARVEPRAGTTRWPGADVVAEPPAAAPVVEAPRPEDLEEPGFDEPPYYPIANPPADRIRRLFRVVLGAGAAAASILFAVSLLRGRGDDRLIRAGVASASPVMTARAQLPPADLRNVESTSNRRVFDPAPSRTVVGKGGAAASAARPREIAPRAGTQSGAPGRAPEPRPTAAIEVATPPSISVSVATTVGQFDPLPAEVLAGLRERLAHGNESVEFGEYANAGRIFGSAIEQITKLSDRYAGAQVLATLRRELEQAAQRATASCRAENEIIRKRNGTALRCD